MGVEQIILRIIGDSSSGERALDKMTKRLRNFGIALTGASDAALVTFAKLGEGGAQIEALEGKFARMAKAFGKSADEMLSQWQEAAAGTISRAELMRKANQAALLGLPVDRLADLLTIARNASEATGESVEYMFDSLVTGIGRQSKMVLDNLGIVFDAEEAYKSYAASIGKTAEQLTAAEQQAAFLSATLKAASRQEALLGKASDNTATQIARAKAAVQDVKDELSKAFVPVAKIAANIVTRLAEIFKAIPTPAKEFIAKLLAMAAGAGAVLGPVITLISFFPKLKAIIGAIGSVLGTSLAAIGPAIAIILALAAAVKIAAKAWKENWGGIRDTVKQVVDVVKPLIDKIAADVRYWVGEIKKELGGIMAAIRSILEPALARLRALFGDGAGLRDFMVFVRDAANVILSTIKNLLEAIRLMLEGNADQAWAPLEDAALNVITLIVIGWRKYISKAVTYGWNLVVNLANGIIKAAKTVLTAAANYIGRILQNFLAPGSPPKEGPLRGIVRWGKGLIDTYLKAFALADFGILRDVLSPLRDALQSAVDLGDIDQTSMLTLFRSVRTQVAGLLAEFRKTGQINEEVMGQIAGQLGEAGKDYMEYLRLTLEHQRALQNLEKIQNKVAEAEKRGFVPAELEKRLKAAEDEVTATEKAANWQREYLEALQDGVDLQREMLEALKEVAETMKGVADALGGGEIAPVVAAETPDLSGEGVKFGGFGGFSEEFERIKEEVRTWFEGLPGKITTWLEAAKTAITTKISEIMTALKKSPLFGPIVEFVDETLLPAIDRMTTGIGNAWLMIRIAYNFLLKPVFDALKTFLVESLLPLWNDLVVVVLRVGFLFMGFLVNAIANYLLLKLGALLDLIGKIKGLEGFEGLDTFLTGAFFYTLSSLKVNYVDPLVSALESLSEKTDAWRGVLDQLNTILGLVDLPDWMTPGSPTPLEIGIRGITDALGGLTGRWNTLNSLAATTSRVGANLAAGLIQGFNQVSLRPGLQANLSAVAPAAAQGNRSTTLVMQFGELVLPGVTSGRDAEGLLERLQEIADSASASGYALGGIMP